ncbi:uncharacterized protein CDAR_551191 [Caerostris darwini]|uniref:SWIM-type domain-containing protein n=1 Tax=Caerostris darwini TaxID=1538125 RepID=A0AAV4VQK0_9ARAC|nr:uncharacterized protein CDAR_551191 [Caerostris darwini]
MQVDSASANNSILLDAVCSAYNCSNKIGETVQGISFHRFPVSKPDLLSKWLTAMRKDKWVPTKSDVLCSFHFTDDQFIENGGHRYLVQNAVPSKFEVLAPPKTLFPSAFPARLLTIRDIECDNRKGYAVEARIPLVNKEQFIEWLRAHEKLAQVSYVLLRNYPTTNKNLSYKAEYVCTYGSNNDRPVKSDKVCPARLLVRIRADPKFRFNKPTSEDRVSLVGYPCNVVLYHLHNHSIGSNTIETKIIPSEEVSTVVKQKFIEMFKGGYTVEMALETHQKDLFEEYTDEYEEVLTDAYVCPTLEWLTNFYANFLEEFEWNNTKTINILKEEIEDINASKGSATMSTIGEDIIVVLSTPLMQRAHSMKSSGEVVFVDNSGYLDRCHCYVYVVMAYSCTEGLPLGLLISTSDTEEILTAGFKLLADILPDKAFGSFGRQGPEVFLTANDDALQNSLKAVYPESAVLLCAYNMSHELWRWLWNPDNGIEEPDRCLLFSLAYKVMQTKTADEFTEVTEALNTNETVQKYDNFKQHFEDIKSHSDRWAVCFKNEILDKDKEISGIEMASHILKDKVFLTKAYNILQLLKYYTDTMETYYRQKIIHCINNTLETFILASFQPEMRETSDLIAQILPTGEYEIKNMKSGKSYYVDMNICVCSCTLGLNGARCKHLYAVCVAKKIDFTSLVPNDDIIKKELFWIATGTMKTGTFDVQIDVDEESDSEMADAPPMRNVNEEPVKSQKEESRKILERVVKNIMQKYDSNPAEFHKAIVTAAVNYQNLNNDREILAALKNFGKQNMFK